MRSNELVKMTCTIARPVDAIVARDAQGTRVDGEAGTEKEDPGPRVEPFRF